MCVTYRDRIFKNMQNTVDKCISPYFYNKIVQISISRLRIIIFLQAQRIMIAFKSYDTTRSPQWPTQFLYLTFIILNHRVQIFYDRQNYM